jgi:predicted permease
VALERGRCNAEAFLVEDFPRPEGQAVQARGIKWISPGYFETQGTRVIAGRTPTWADVFGVVPVVLINDRPAREYWRTPAEAIGKRVRESAKSPWREIVGVVANERQDGLAQEAPPLMYWPYSVDGWYTPGRHTRAQLTCIVRSPRTGSPTLLAEVARAVHSVDRDIPLSRVRTFDGIVAESMSQTSFALVLLAIAGAVSLLLGIVGIYGVTSYIAAQRTREVGIRLALGAQTRDVTRLFVRHGLRLAALGVAVGVLAALALSRLMTSLLFNVKSTDPLTYAAVSAGLAVVAVVAGYLPARRAARLDPVVALRAER